MSPTINDKQIIIVNKIYYIIPLKAMEKYPKINSIIVYKDSNSNKLFVKRCIGNYRSSYKMEGNILKIDNYKIKIDNNKKYLFKDFTNIPKNDIFVMGDNNNNSKDSRSMGFINRESIIGNVIFYGKKR